MYSKKRRVVFVMSSKKQRYFFLDILGILFVLSPYLLLIASTINHLLDHHGFLIDFLIPLELGFILLPGALLLMLSSMKTKQAYLFKSLLFIICVITMMLVMFIPSLAGFSNSNQNIHSFWYIITYIATGIFDVSGFILVVISIIKLK